MNLKNKVVVVTGASGGIGRELVKKLKIEGAKIISVSRNNSDYNCDFNDQLKTKKIANQISEEHKNIDILINCAGIGIYKPLEDLTLEDWNRSMNICTTSSFLFMKNLIKNISNSDNSLILNIGSGAGVIPMAGRSAYCAAKFALRGITLSLAEEYKRIGKPKFCLITLGSTLTSFGPLSFEEKKLEMEKGKAYFTPEWVAEKLTEIIKDENREMEYVLYPGDYGFGEWEVPEPK
jgi:short-subunit dehydrogenase